MTAIQPATALRLKSGEANKVGQRSSGLISYELLADEARQTLWVRIVANQSSGYFSRELVDFNKVEACVEGFRDGKPLPSKVFVTAFVGRSVNHGGFMAAVLRAEGLLAPAPDNNFQHVVCGNWQAWRTSHLKLPGEAIELAPSSEMEGEGRTAAPGSATAKSVPERTERKKPGADSVAGRGKPNSDKVPGTEGRHADDS